MFEPRQWTVPVEFRTAYDSFKVRLTLHWYAKNKVTERGQVTVEFEYYGLERAGQPFDPATSTYGPGHCAGSLNAPQLPPDLGTRAPIPTGFVRMSHWRPYWKGFSEDQVQATIAELTRMHQSGVILTGLQTGNKYVAPRRCRALPPDVP